MGYTEGVSASSAAGISGFNKIRGNVKGEEKNSTETTQNFGKNVAGLLEPIEAGTRAAQSFATKKHTVGTTK